MIRLTIPFLLVVGMILLIITQCTLIHHWVPWGIRLELLPTLLFYTSFTANLPTSLTLSLLAALMYDSFSGGPFGSSMIPYVVSTSVFCAVRPIFFRNRISTHFVGAMIFSLIAVFLQWVFSGKFSVGLSHVTTKIVKISVLSGALGVLYFVILDFLFRLVGLQPGRIEDIE